MHIGQTSVDSLSENARPAFLLKWRLRNREACGRQDLCDDPSGFCETERHRRSAWLHNVAP